MRYFTTFFYECPATGQEYTLEVHFSREEEPADQVEYWGQMIYLPASEEIEITTVFRDGDLWEDYPNIIEQEIYTHDWESQVLCAQA